MLYPYSSILSTGISVSHVYTRFSLSMEMSRLTRDGTAEPVSRDQILRHARGQGNIIFPVQLTTSRIGNLTRLIHTLLYVMTIHTYIPVDTTKHMPYRMLFIRIIHVARVRGCVSRLNAHSLNTDSSRKSTPVRLDYTIY